jgi:tetratricopeptide (TPR) repeat protein
VTWYDRKPLLLLLFLLGSLALYGASLGNGYVLDDQAAVEENSLAHWPPRPLEILQANYWGNRPGYEKLTIYRPLATLTFALVDGLPGPAPALQRSVNIVLHGIASWLVYALALALGLAVLPAAAAGLLFLVHPVHSEAVLGVVSRAELLAAVFILLGALLVVRWRGRGELLQPARLATLAAVFLLALLSKENGATLLPAILLLAVFGLPRDPLASRAAGTDTGRTDDPLASRAAGTDTGRTDDPLASRADGTDAGQSDPGGSNPSRERSERIRFYLSRLPLLALLTAVLAAYFFLRHAMLSGVLAGDLAFEDNPMLGADFAGRWLTPFKLLYLYAGLLLVPHTLTVDYSWAQVLPAASLFELEVLGGLLLALGMLAALVLSLRRSGQVATLLLLFAGTYAVISNFAFLSTIIMAERVFYTPSAFLILLLVAGAASLLRPRLALALLAVIVLAFSVRTALRIPDFANPLTLAHSAATAAPASAKSRHLLALELGRLGATAEALKEYEAALAISPDNFNMLTNYGLALLQAQRPEEALTAFIRAQDASKGRHKRSWNLLCNTAANLGREEVLRARCR